MKIDSLGGGFFGTARNRHADHSPARRFIPVTQPPALHSSAAADERVRGQTKARASLQVLAPRSFDWPTPVRAATFSIQHQQPARISLAPGRTPRAPTTDALSRFISGIALGEGEEAGGSLHLTEVPDPNEAIRRDDRPPLRVPDRGNAYRLGALASWEGEHAV